MLRTRQKLFIASVLFQAIKLVRAARGGDCRARVTRRGVRWELDLAEGIDLAIYALGAFEKRTLRSFERLIKPGFTILDIGANVGAHTLPMARLTGPQGKVIAVEPTAFAWRKLLRNIELNPGLAERIVVKQAMLVEAAGVPLEDQAYASWPIACAALDRNLLHARHGGRKMPTTGARVLTLDELWIEMGRPLVHFMKIDVDGNEPAVLAGGKMCLGRNEPIIAIEFAPYLHERNFGKFIELIGIFKNLGYSFHDLDSGRAYPIDAQRIRGLIPDGASRNILAEPRNSSVFRDRDS